MAIAPLVTLKALLSVLNLKHMIQTNWTMNNTRPDSINIEMRDEKSCIPVACACRRARDALAILNTSRPVNMAFTARDTEKDSMPMGVNQIGGFWVFCGPSTAISPTSVNDVATAWVSKRSICSSNFSSTYPGILMLKWREQLQQPVVGSTPPNSGISEKNERKVQFSFRTGTYQNPLINGIDEGINYTGA